MAEATDAAALTAVVVAEEEARRAAQAAAEAGELLPDDLLPGVGGTPMPLREGLRTGGLAMIVSLLLVNVIETFDNVALQTLGPDIQKSLDVSKTTLQGITSLSGVVLVLSTLPFAWLADRHNRTKILAAATTLWSVFIVLTGFAANVVLMGLARVGAGFGASARLPISPSLIADSYPIGVRARMFAAEGAGRPLGLVIGPFFVGAVAASVGGADGWRWALVATAVAALVIALSLFFLREPGRGRNEQEAVLGHVLSADDEPPVRLSAVSARLNKVKTFRYLTLGIGMLGFALVSVPSRLSFLFEETYGFDAFKRGWVLSLTYIPALVVIPIAGRYGDLLFRRDPRWATRLFGWLVIGYGVFIAVGSQLDPVVLLIAFVALANGLQLAAFTQVGPIISAVVPYRMRAQAFALVGFYIFLLGGFFGGLMVAAVADAYGERTALIAVAPFGAILGGLLVLRGARFMKRDISLVVEELLDEQAEQRRIAADPDNVPVLQVHNVDTSYGPVQILFDINLEVRRGEVLALLGTNGAGKSTLLKTISGLVMPDRGVVRMNGRTITLTDPEIRVAMGMSQIPGGEGVFPNQSVAEHLEIWSWLIEDHQRRTERIEVALDTFPGLRHHLKSRAGSLSGGQQQMLALSKAVMLEPELLLIDELSLGLAPLVVQDLLEVVRGLRASGVTMVIVEQSANVALSIADRAIFMERGRIRFEGAATELLERDDLLRAVFLSGEGRVMALGLTISEQIVFSGVIRGMVYALVAIGIVLVFRASGVINFAQGQFGALGATILSLLMVNYGWPFWLALPIAIATGAVLGGITELLVVRRLFKQPRLLLFVATIGMAQVILLVQLQLPTVEDNLAFPTAFDRVWKIGALTVRGEQLIVLLMVPIIVVILAVLLQRTRFGLAVRSAADNPSAASLSGVRVKAVSTQVWIVAGTVAAVSAVIAAPVLNQRTNDIAVALGPDLLLRGLVAALFGAMVSFPLALVGGVVIGVVEGLVLANTTGSPGTDTLVMFILLIVVVLFRARSQSADESAWTLTPRTRAARAELLKHPLARVVRYAGVALLFAVGLALPAFFTTAVDMNDMTSVLIFLMVAVSATVLTGWAGQLSLGQFAFVAIGAYLTAYYGQSLGFIPSILLGTLWGMGVALAIGIPALRVRGLYLAIITLGFALMVSNYLLLTGRLNTYFTGYGTRLTPPVLDVPLLGRLDLAQDKDAYYYLCFVALLVVIAIVTHLRRTGIGRTLLAVRDNDSNAAAYTVSPTRAKLIAFGLSGGVAAFAGGLFAAQNATMFPDYFTPAQSIRVLSVAVVGGLTSVTGAILGTLVVVAIPLVFSDTPELQLFASGVGMLILLLYLPGGLISVVQAGRDQLLEWLARRTGWEPPAGRESADVATLSTRDRRAETEATVPLRTDDVRVRFGGLFAVGGVSIHVGAGEVVGLIGTNGAGKTTLMNAISGFVKSSGTVEVFGHRVDRMAPYRRSRQGMGRSFQKATIFGGLTVRETIMVALEARERSLLVPSLVALPPSPFAERRKRNQAREVIAYLGLGRYADNLVSELSTGTRRIVELGALLALDTRLMLLDEPTAGVAQRETEAFGPLIKAIQKDLGCAILIIEHDMPMVMSISDRIYCLEAGLVIAEGTPDSVRNDPAVIASYLGTDQRAIHRSGTGGPGDETVAPVSP